jgi:predicted membrane channel-forming protein YqfA (hemolysin III family)
VADEFRIRVFRDPASSWSHFIGFWLALAAAAVYARAGPDPRPGRFGHHETWHLFVLAGAAAHYVFACSSVDAPYAPS